MKKQSLVVVLTLALLSASLPASAQTSKRALSPTLSLVGVLGVIGGIAMMVPQGENYRVLGDTFCVKEKSIDYGGCTVDPYMRTMGKYVLLGGAAATVIGVIPVSKHVSIGAMPMRKGMTARATLKF